MDIPNLILVVDDDYATLDFLRSILELSEGDYDVLGVPSAEEALLALRRASFDLLVADVRLPGMDGLQLAQRARELSPGIPVIMITGYDSVVVEEEAARLEVSGYFSKPLDAEDFLSAVNDAISGAYLGRDKGAVTVDGTMGESVPLAVVKRVETLRADIGASQVILAAITGKTIFCAGGQQDQQLQQLVTAIAFSMDRNFHLSDHLGASQPQAIQYLVGERSDLYCANIDRDYFVAILFDAQVRRGRIGTVWVFTQRAIKDLRSLLGESWGGEQGAGFASPTTKETVSEDPLPLSPQDGGVEQTPTQQIPDPMNSVEEVGQDSEPTDNVIANDDSNHSPAVKALNWNRPDPDGVDIESLLDETANADEDDQSSISFEEAMKRGIIAPDFDPEDE